MTRISHALAAGLAFWGLAGCGAPPAPGASQAANSSAPHEPLSRAVDRFWEERMSIGDDLRAQSLADTLALERRYLAEILAVPRDSLDAESKLTYDIFRRQREQDIEAFTYPAELLPVTPFDGPPFELARAAADMGQYPLKTAQDYANWLLRMEDSARWMRQAIENMREGMRRGYTSPRLLMERELLLLQVLGEDTSANVFYAPLRNLPESIKDPERTRLGSTLGGAVKDRLLPGIRELHDFIQKDYLPRARQNVALSALPLGSSWYASRVRRATDTRLTPNEIHGIGTAEVERIRARLQLLPAPPAPPAIAGSADPLSTYGDLKAQALAAVPTLFSELPRADFEIRPANLLGMDSALAYRAADGATPAILYVNAAVAHSGGAALAEFLEETLPGRHLQNALQQERAGLPKFRRFGAAPAFVEGWALYAASLGEELVLYRDDEAKRGAAIAQLKCAAALVVDTGLHAKGWTYTQAVDYLRAQLALDEAGAVLMTDRVVARPGDALACKMGEMKFQALRVRAQQLLGPKFDYREFHSEVLRDGAMPLDILEAKLRVWMEARR